MNGFMLSSCLRNAKTEAQTLRSLAEEEKEGRSKTMRKEDEYKVILMFETLGEISNPMRLTKILRKAVGEIKSARYLTNNRVIVFCLNKKTTRNVE